MVAGPQLSLRKYNDGMAEMVAKACFRQRFVKLF
jgi:hypothetical protein